ncbi:site-specific integrase [Vibrio hannami]|uniref:site-specific integrase n=1 Tax=Vibrio hannami TaxID=2717094 RepID=UPI00240FEB9C|nr:site-specific integrase [Vibrio hannami]MDG3085385.1 site-specific integrase [Vibrio hannami]
MGVINVRNNKLVLQFRYKGQRCREQTQLLDTAANRKRLTNLLKRIEAEIIIDTFDYEKYFPNSKAVTRFKDLETKKQTAQQYFDSVDSPKVKDFSEIWLSEKKIEWRKGHYQDVEGILNKYIIPMFGNKKISAITKQQILSFRSTLAKVPGRKGKELSPSRINHIMTPLRVMLNEAADRYDFTSPWKNIKALKVGRTEVDPFNLQEVEQVIAHAPDKYKPYYITRFFTGLRTGEIDGLMWKDVNLDNKTITVNQSLVRGELSDVKTEGSYRVVMLTDRVTEALREHKKTAYLKDKYVFTNDKRLPLNYQTLSKSIWYPTLRRAKLRPRNPYQTRHTYATLLLASGEAPEWIANQMGHTTTTMLFRVYSRYVPNLTRRDGSAFEHFLQKGGEA